ncbi:MAG: nucleoside deaminase [Proteobacteria bacterium]|nr:nucleoside deaminase [Pseudomonadota bacterium]
MTTDHEKYMQLALDEARQALVAGDFPVGCVLVANGEVVAKGKRANSRFTGNQTPNELDHAEILALRELKVNHPDIHPSEIIAYSTMEPCLMCYSTLLLNGIHKIVYAFEDAMGGGTGLPLARLTPLYRDMDVQLIPHILRPESLKLFADFFNNPHNSYWENSYLAEYTLEQARKDLDK